MAWPTPAQVVSAAGRELGLFATDISDPFASTDNNVRALTSLLMALGQSLARSHAWSQLQIEGVLTTASGAASYPLPAGFVRFIDQTEWNRTQRLPVLGLGPQMWQQVKAQTNGALAYKSMRIQGGAIHLYDTPTATESIYYEYQTKYWVRDAITAWANNTAYTAGAIRSNAGVVYTCTTGGTSAVVPATGPSGGGSGITDGSAVWTYSYPSVDAAPPTAESSDTSTDYLLFDYRLLVDGLKLSFRRHKGLDTTSEQQAYDATLSAVLGGDGVARVLSLGGRARSGLITVGNAPEGGYG